jgi:hypothetical protein
MNDSTLIILLGLSGVFIISFAHVLWILAKAIQEAIRMNEDD